jgi:hypothetical protein
MKIQEYRERIWELERENAALRERIVRLQAEVERNKRPSPVFSDLCLELGRYVPLEGASVPIPCPDPVKKDNEPIKESP